MKRVFQKALQNAERDPYPANVFYRINTEAKAIKVARASAAVPAFIAFIYLLGTVLMALGIVQAPTSIILVQLLSAAVALYLAWQLYNRPQTWTIVAVLLWLLVELVRMFADGDPQDPGTETVLTAYVLMAMIGILGLRGVRKLKQFQNTQASS